MDESEPSPQIGQVVEILRGRDEGKSAVVIGIVNERFVLIADGDKRKFDSPKKKNIRHLKCYHYVSSVVQESMKETGRVTNGKLRFALNKFSDHVDANQEKGE